MNLLNIALSCSEGRPGHHQGTISLSFQSIFNPTHNPSTFHNPERHTAEKDMPNRAHLYLCYKSIVHLIVSVDHEA